MPEHLVRETIDGHQGSTPASDPTKFRFLVKHLPSNVLIMCIHITLLKDKYLTLHHPRREQV